MQVPSFDRRQSLVSRFAPLFWVSGIAFLFCYLSLSAFAQTVPINKRAQAEADLKAAQAALEQLSGQSGTEWLCQTRRWTLRKNYAQWFLDHSAEITDSDNAVRAMKKEVQVKLGLLQKEGIVPLAAEGQTTPVSVQVSIQDLISYLRLLNSRMKSCGPGQLEAVIKQHDDARTTSILAQGKRIHLNHTQVVDLLAKMTTNLNASLRESANSYSVELERGLCGFDLVLRAQVKVGTSGTQQLTMSLLDADPKPKFSAPNRVAGQLVSGLGRYLEMHFASLEAACYVPGWAGMEPARVADDADPYVSFDRATAEFQRLLSVPTGGQTDAQEQLRRQFGVEFRPTAFCRKQTGEQYGIETYQISVEGIPLVSNSCMGKPMVVPTEKGKFYVFAVSSGYIFYTEVSTGADTGKTWSWNYLNASAAHLLGARLIDGQPAVAYLTNQGELQSLNLNSQAVAASRFSLPALLRSAPARVELVHSKECDDRSRSVYFDVREVSLNGHELGSQSCVIDAKGLSFYDTTVVFAIDSNRYLTARLENSSWFSVAGTALTRIKSVDLVNGIPVATVITDRGLIQRYNLKGELLK